jgi:hypothetical protein
VRVVCPQGAPTNAQSSADARCAGRGWGWRGSGKQLQKAKQVEISVMSGQHISPHSSSHPLPPPPTSPPPPSPPQSSSHPPPLNLVLSFCVCPQWTAGHWFRGRLRRLRQTRPSSSQEHPHTTEASRRSPPNTRFRPQQQQQAQQL